MSDEADAAGSIAPDVTPPATRGWQGWRRLLGTPTPVIFGASVIVAALLLWRQGSLGDLQEAARGADLIVAITGVVLYAAGLSLLCLRWHALVGMAGGQSDLPVASEAFLTSVVINYAAPIGLAVPTRAALSKRDLGLSVGASGAVAFWEVALDILILGLLSLAWLAVGDIAVLRSLEDGLQVAIPLAVAAITVVAILAIIAARSPWLRHRVATTARDVLRYPVERRGKAALALGLTLLFWALQGIIFQLLLDSVGVIAGPVVVLGLLAPPVLVGMVSPVPGGAGVREALMVAVAQAGSVDSAKVLLAAVAYRVALFVAIPVLYAGVRLWRHQQRATIPANTFDKGDVRDERESS